MGEVEQSGNDDVCPYRTLETSSDTLITPTVGTYPVYVRNTTTDTYDKMDTEYRIQFSCELSHRVQGKKRKIILLYI